MENQLPDLIRPIFILGCHKSGTSLMRSLLDNHPSLNVLPKETHFFQWSGRWVDYALRTSWPKQLNSRDLIEALVKGVNQANMEWIDPYSDNPSFVNGYDIERFRFAMEKFKLDTLLNQIQAYFQSLNYALHGLWIPTNRHLVEKSVESAEFAFILRFLFPDCKFVHIVRNPYANIYSLRKSKMKKGYYPYLGRLISSLYNSSNFLFKNSEILRNYYVIRYEDLVSNPQLEMKNIADFLDIDFERSLVEPSSMGEPWRGNSSHNQNFSGISSSQNDRWHNEITSLEVQLVNLRLWPILEKFNYERVEASNHVLRPNKKERPIIYLKNRALL